ncbi:MAG: hypothetical protein C4287_23090 [Leptolyngbya sp. ERB_1_2]
MSHFLGPPPRPPDCPEQDFGFTANDAKQDSNFNIQELSALAQMAVGESGYSFNRQKTEAVIATAVNRLSANVIYASQRQPMPFIGGLDMMKILSSGYDATRWQSGAKKLNQAKSQNGGTLPEVYVCDQLVAAKKYIRHIKGVNLNSPNNAAWAEYPFTSNFGGGLRVPLAPGDVGSGARAIYGNTIFYNRRF